MQTNFWWNNRKQEIVQTANQASVETQLVTRGLMGLLVKVTDAVISDVFYGETCLAYFSKRKNQNQSNPEQFRLSNVFHGLITFKLCSKGMILFRIKLHSFAEKQQRPEGLADEADMDPIILHIKDTKSYGKSREKIQAF